MGKGGGEEEGEIIKVDRLDRTEYKQIDKTGHTKRQTKHFTEM